MVSKFTKMILTFAVAAAMMTGCTENGGKSQKQQQEQRQEQQQVEKIKADEAKLLTEEHLVEMDEKKWIHWLN